MAQAAASESMTSPKRDPQTVLARLLDAANKAGADAADALYVEGVLQRLYRLGKLEDVERAENLRPWPARLCGTESGFRLLDRFFRRGAGRVAGPRRDHGEAGAGRPLCRPGSPDRLAKNIPGLDLEDAQEPSAETLIERARAVEGGAGGERHHQFRGQRRHPSRAAPWRWPLHRFLWPLCRHQPWHRCRRAGGRRHRHGCGYDHASARRAALRAAEEIGHAAGKAVRRLNPRSMPSQALPVVFHPDEAAGRAGPFRRRHFRAAIARGVSFLKDRLGQPVFASERQVMDDPHAGAACAQAL